MSSVKVATAMETKKQRKAVPKAAKKQSTVSTVQAVQAAEAAQKLTPSDIAYYSKPIDSPNFIRRKNAVIAGLTAQYWANKALAAQQQSS